MHSRPLCMGLVCSLLLLATTPILAQDKKLPEAKQILAQHLKMIGGQENIAKIKSLETEGKLTIRGTGLGGTIKVTNEEGGRFLQVTEIAGIGREVVGSDGKV